ncbi:hypothetical protein BDW74DRAFT_178089 [Aspergillus multicolor]|uniref:uncharacterized protein n=1 Tax=Aspergillus multicolor TaxID=41759 RepID=UPI003CCE2151
MDNWQTVIDTRKIELTRLFVIDGWTLEQVRQHLVGSERGLSSLTLGRLQNLLSSRHIFKNIQEEEAFRIKEKLGNDTTNRRWLILANEAYIEEKGCRTKPESAETHRQIVYVNLPFEFTSLKNPDIFRTTQLLFFHAGVHFDSSFDTGIWTPDARGLYARTEPFRDDLSNLSDMHNKVVAALNEHKAGRTEHGQALMDQTTVYNPFLVRNRHHRQLSDILAILLLLHRDGFIAKQQQLTDSLITLARANLHPNDPRRVWFESLDGLALDAAGHLYQAFDAFCRKLWEMKVGLKDAKGCYSYNQASLPRADPGGFYRFFENRPLAELELMLKEVDTDLGARSHESFMIWHTAIRCLQREHRFKEQEELVRRLLWRVTALGVGFDYAKDLETRQLNYDCMITFYLLGNALQSQGDLPGAEVAFKLSVGIRAQLVRHRYDAGKAGALRRVEEIRQLRAAPLLKKDDYEYIEMSRIMYDGVVSRNSRINP